jgi:hypothetical protein
MAELDQQSLIETRLIEAKAYADGMQADAAIAREQARTSASMIKRATPTNLRLRADEQPDR